MSMKKNITLTSKEIELLTIALCCMDEESYYKFTTLYSTYSDIKEQKEQLRTKLKSVLYGE